MATVRLHTGELRLTNIGDTNFDLVGYTISFPTDSLLFDNWNHIAGLRDSGGNGSIDPTGSWIILQPEQANGVFPSRSDVLAEAALTLTSGVLTPGEKIYLGQVWDPSTPLQLAVEVAPDGGQPLDTLVLYLSPGDYNEDGYVDQDDYDVWKNSFGATGSGLLADGNADGRVDLADYTLWRDYKNMINTAANFAAPLTLSRSAIPEPATITLATIVATLWAGANYRRRTG